jgi:hypothetical protein
VTCLTYSLMNKEEWMSDEYRRLVISGPSVMSTSTMPLYAIVPIAGGAACGGLLLLHYLPSALAGLPNRAQAEGSKAVFRFHQRASVFCVCTAHGGWRGIECAMRRRIKSAGATCQLQPATNSKQGQVQVKVAKGRRRACVVCRRTTDYSG